MRRKILRYPFKIIPAMSFGYTQDTEEKVNFFDMEGGEVGRRRKCLNLLFFGILHLLAEFLGWGYRVVVVALNSMRCCLVRHFITTLFYV